MRRRNKVFFAFSVAVLIGTLLLVGTAAWFLWRESIRAEERAVEDLARQLGKQTEAIIVEARRLLQRLDKQDVVPCSDGHLGMMDRAAFRHSHILAIGYWEAAERLCGAGFSQAIQLKPPQADRIYDNGLVAWWPGEQTRVGDMELFLMRHGRYDVAIDPGQLLQATPARGRRIGLWVEGRRMAAVPWKAELPLPDSMPHGLSVDHAEGRIVSRFSLGTVLPIDVVVVEPIGHFWNRYWYVASGAGGIVVLLTAFWIYAVSRFTRRRLGLAAELRESLARGQIEACYQPIVELESGRCVGAEVLARWHREDGEAVNTETLVAVAEDAGLVPRITLAMLDAALRDLGPLLRSDREIRINLNLAPEDLESPAFSEALARRIRQAKVVAQSIKLEITERALLNSKATRRIISELRSRGHDIAIDDFGTGYSSLSYLESFELDTLKIDKSFVDAIGTEAVTSNVVYHVIELAKGLQLETVAEGVETEEQAAWLYAQGVRYVQGYLFSRPLSARRFREFLHSRGKPRLRPVRAAEARS